MCVTFAAPGSASRRSRCGTLLHQLVTHVVAGALALSGRVVDKVLVTLYPHTLEGYVATNEMANGGNALASQKRSDLKYSLPNRL